MSFHEMKAWLRDRLHLRGPAATDINLQGEEAPHERPVLLWKRGDDEFCNQFKRAVLALVEEATTEPWQSKPFNELCLMLESMDLWEAVRPLEVAAQSRRLLKRQQGVQLHMLVLRTLLALDWKGTPEFWLTQGDIVGHRWPGIIFEGLAHHDVESAFKRLPTLVTGPDGMRQVVQLFPGLMRELRLAASTLRDHASNIVGDLQPEASETLREWFRLRDAPLVAVKSKATSRGLRDALGKYLGPDREARHISPMLGCSVQRPVAWVA